MLVDDKWIIFFGEDWGRHHSTGQFLAVELAKEYKILWINSLGLRTPKLNVYDISRILSKLVDFASSLVNQKAKNNHQEGIPNIEVFAPLAIPLLQSPFIRKLNKLILLKLVKSMIKRLSISKPIVITACPASVDLVNELDARLKVYYCADEYSVLPGMDKQLVRSLEDELLEQVDVVAVTAKTLLPVKSKKHDHVYYLPHGVDYQLFHKAIVEKSVLPEDIADIKAPIIGFVGLIGEHIDMGLIRDLSNELKELVFVMIGPLEEGLEAVEASNIFYLGEKQREQLPLYLAHFAGCIIPYKQTERIKFASPTKLNEYLAAGCPVITVPHPEIVEGTLGVHVAGDNDSFVRCIRNLLKTPVSDRVAISRSISHATWQHRAQHLLEIIDSSLRR